MLLYRTSLMNTNDDIVYKEDSQYEAKWGYRETEDRNVFDSV